jgi:hypothetical protein
MSVYDSPMVRVVVAAAVIAMGCGGRTTLSDDESFTAGGTPGVAGSTGIGASAGKPVQPDSTAASATCQTYCRRYTVQCPRELQGQDCLAACRQEFEGNQCERAGLEALECLTPFFDDPNDPAEDCGGATRRALTHCRHEIAALDRCRP